MLHSNVFRFLALRYIADMWPGQSIAHMTQSLITVSCGQVYMHVLQTFFSVTTVEVSLLIRCIIARINMTIAHINSLVLNKTAENGRKNIEASI